MLNEEINKIAEATFGKSEEPTPKLTVDDLSALFKTKLKDVKDFDSYYNLVKEIVLTKDVAVVPHNASIKLIVTNLAEASPFELTSGQIAHLVALASVLDASQKHIAFRMTSSRFRTLGKYTLMEILTAPDVDLFSMDFLMDLAYRVYSKELPEALSKLNPAMKEAKFIDACGRLHKRGILPENTNDLYAKLFVYIHNHRLLNYRAEKSIGVPYCDYVTTALEGRAVSSGRRVGKSRLVRALCMGAIVGSL